MIENSVRLISLCCVTEDIDRIWLTRVADLNGQELVFPVKSDRATIYFENRDRLFINDGPSDIGSIGVWEWTARPNLSDPARDYVQTHFLHDITPIRVVNVPKVHFLKELVDTLKAGQVWSKHYYCDTLFCFQSSLSKVTGVLCKQNEFTIENRVVILQDNVYSFPVYSINTQDIVEFGDKHLSFIKQIPLGDPEKFIQIGDIDSLIRSIILDRLTWPLYKSCIGSTKAEWRNCKTLFERACGSSLYEDVANPLKCSAEQAAEYVQVFIERASSLIDAGDIDSEIIAKIALHNDDLRNSCEASLTKKWQAEHTAQIAAANAAFDLLRTKIDSEISAARQQLQSTEEQTRSAVQNKELILADIAAAQAELSALKAEIEEHNALGAKTLDAVRAKISAAQADMASFIAEMSVFLPNAPVSAQNDSAWHYTPGILLPYFEDEADVSQSWKDECRYLSENLHEEYAVSTDLCGLLAAFLYSAHLNHVPLLIAGPYGKEIADTLSISIFGQLSGLLSIEKTCTSEIVKAIPDHEDNIVSIQNMFGQGWSDALPQAFSESSKHIVWTHPYVEDLVIEPKGLYNYAFPLLSECFVGSIPKQKTVPAQRAPDFLKYNATEKKPLRLRAFKRLGLSKLLLNRLTVVLSDAKLIVGRENSELDIELLFGLLPLTVLLGKQEILKDTLEKEKGLSGFVKEEASRYIEEE